jgi:hypothetical protein
MSAHATLAIEPSGLEVPRRCSCAPAATGRRFDFVLGMNRWSLHGSPMPA